MTEDAWLVVTLTALVGCVVAIGVLSRRLFVVRRRLDDTVAARDTLLLRDRDLAIHASHRLRTPITALRLSLEDLSHWAQTAPEVSRELETSIREIDRWGLAVDEVLGDAHGHRLAAARDVDLAELTRAFVTTHAQRVGDRELVHRSRGPVPARVDPTAVHDVLSRLLQHLVEHGSGPVRVEAAAQACHLRVRISDTGARTLDPGVVRPGGVGQEDPRLVEAGAIAESVGGYVALKDRPTTRFVLLLPATVSASPDEHPSSG